MVAQGTGRSRSGWADGRCRQSRHRSKPWWFNKQPLWSVAAQAEAVAVAQTAAMDSRATGRSSGGCGAGDPVGGVCFDQFAVGLGPRAHGRSRGGRTDGCSGQSWYRPKSWWCGLAKWLAVSSGLERLAVSLALDPTARSRGGCGGRGLAGSGFGEKALTCATAGRTMHRDRERSSGRQGCDAVGWLSMIVNEGQLTPLSWESEE